MRHTTFLWALAGLLAGAAVASAFDGGLVANGDFAQGLASWVPYGDAHCFSAGPAPGPEGHALLYRHAAGKQQRPVHLDQTVSVEPGTVYALSFRALNEGKDLRPALRIAGMDWQTIGYYEAPPGAGWQSVSALVSPGKATQVRVQLFGAGRENPSPDPSGQAWFSSVALRKATPDELRQFYSAEIRVSPDEPLVAVSPLFFGVNALFWIENDASRADGKLAKLLGDMHCSLLRFPGGEVADNYHWQTNRLDDTRDFPFTDGPPTMDLDEFWQWKLSIGAEATFVVNLESGYLHGRPDEGVAEAVAWLQDCRAKGRHVAYWEIGNETNLLGTRYPLTAREYAAAVVQYSRAMKAVDPAIKIGALGFDSPRAASILDAVPPEKAAALRALDKRERHAMTGTLRDLPRREDPEPWWPTLCREARGAFDFAIIHRYDGSRLTFDRDCCQPLKIKDALADLQAYFTHELGSPMPLALTEWNVGQSAKLTRIEHALTIAEQIGNYLEAGVTLGNYWPMRYDQKNEAGFRMLIDYYTNEPRAAYDVLREFSLHGRGRVLKCQYPQNLLYTLATCDATGATLFAVNRCFRPEGIAASIDMPGMRLLEAHALVGDESQFAGARLSSLDVSPQQSGRWPCRLPPGSLSVLRFTLPPVKQ